MTDDCATGEHVDCARVLADLAVYLDRELDDEAQMAVIQEHLGDCPPCQDKADLEECVKELVRNRCCEDAPEGLAARIQSALGLSELA